MAQSGLTFLNYQRKLWNEINIFHSQSWSLQQFWLPKDRFSLYNPLYYILKKITKKLRLWEMYEKFQSCFLGWHADLMPTHGIKPCIFPARTTEETLWHSFHINFYGSDSNLRTHYIYHSSWNKCFSREGF